MGTVWELNGNNGNLMKTQPTTLSKKIKYLGGMLAPPQLAVLLYPKVPF